MKLLLITQTLDNTDSNLGFFHRWIEEFAKRCEHVEVICLNKGSYTLPNNVSVHSLGKEEGKGKGIRTWRFYKYIFSLRNNYDAVFVHMNPEYIVLGGFWWKRWHKKMGLWYAHRSNTLKLRRAVKKLDYVFVVAEESFAIRTPKLRAMGHGIDTELFKPQIKERSTFLRIATTGRIAQSKHLIEMMSVLEDLYARREQFIFTIVGAPVTEAEEMYAKKLHDVVDGMAWKDKVRFLGALPHAELPEFLNTQDLFFNFSTTGNMDKAGLEALAVGVPLITINPAFETMLAPYGLYVSSHKPKDIADALLAFKQRPDQPAILSILRNKVVAEHSLSNLIPRILSVLQS